MNYFVGTVALAALVFAGCGKKDGEGDESGGEGKSAAAKCSESNKVDVAWTDKEMHAPGAFKHTHTIGYESGMVMNGKSLHKIGYVALANFDVKLGQYMADMPKEEGQQLILIKFKTADVPTAAATNKSDYAKLSLTAGEQKLGPRQDSGFDVTYFVGGKNSGPSVTGSKAKGGATLTTVDGSLCGSIDLTTPRGSTLKGTFNAPILKDLWAK